MIVGQDTDSESTPYGAAMPWIVKLDKEEDFIGRWALEHAAEHPAEYALVGFTMANGHVPTEGAVVLPGGQVTSSRRSPQLGKVIGMAWVPAAQAADGATITISDEGARVRRDRDDGAVLRPRGGGAAVVSFDRLRDVRGSRRPRRVVARSPMERQARAAGARFELRDGWNVAVSYPGEAARCATSAFADASHIRKYELQGDADLRRSSSAARPSTATPPGCR